MKIYPTNLERRFPICIFNIELISRIFQKHLQIRIDKPIEKMSTLQIASRHAKVLNFISHQENEN